MSEPSRAVARVSALVADVVDLRHAATLIGWDERVCMPPGGVAVHGDMAATIQRIAHEKFTSAELGDALEDAARDVASLPPDSEPARIVAVTARDYRRAVRVPSDYVEAHARVASAAHQAWKEAREQSRYAMFEPHLRKVVDLARHTPGFFSPSRIRTTLCWIRTSRASSPLRFRRSSTCSALDRSSWCAPSSSGGSNNPRS